VAISFLSLQGSRYSNEKRKDKRDEVNGAGNWKDVSKKQRGRRTKTKITHLFMPDPRDQLVDLARSLLILVK
jgi:hypothetical protein